MDDNETLIEILQRLTAVETKLDSMVAAKLANAKKNGGLDIKTWAQIIFACLGLSSATNYGVQSLTKSEPVIQYVPVPQMTYTQPRPDGR